MHASSLNNFRTLEESLNYFFKDKELLLEAITHRSFCHEYPGQSRRYNERIEFLGDAVLGLVITETLYIDNPHLEESQMSKFKSYLVSGRILAQIASTINLGEFLYIGKGEESSGGRNKISILANTLEAIFGAVFLDSDYNSAKSVVLQLYTPIIEKVLKEGILDDFKTELQEISQMMFNRLPQYKLLNESGNDHNKTFVYEVYLNGKKYGEGKGKNKKSAQRNAARTALDRLKNE